MGTWIGSDAVSIWLLARCICEMCRTCSYVYYTAVIKCKREIEPLEEKNRRREVAKKDSPQRHRDAERKAEENAHAKTLSRKEGLAAEWIYHRGLRGHGEEIYKEARKAKESDLVFGIEQTPLFSSIESRMQFCD